MIGADVRHPPIPNGRPIGIDVFCGAGGMSLGFEQAGVHVLAAFDKDPVHVRAHSSNFPSCVTERADVSQLSGMNIRNAAGLQDYELDILFGGPPCQGFSEIGRREYTDPRNQLILQFARLIRELEPRYFVMENVPGLLFERNRPLLDTFIESVLLSGYNLSWPLKKLDCSHFGVPQSRQRVFIVGHRVDQVAPMFPSPDETNQRSVWNAIGDLAIVDLAPDLLVGDVYTGELGSPSTYAQIMRGDIQDPLDASLPRKQLNSRITGCSLPKHTAETVARFAATDPGRREVISRFTRLTKEGLSPTLRAGTGPDQGSFTAPRPIHPVYPRCITVREAARLHSIPDWFVLDATKWHGFRQVGNAVPPLMARAVAKGIVATRCQPSSPREN